MYVLISPVMMGKPPRSSTLKPRKGGDAGGRVAGRLDEGKSGNLRHPCCSLTRVMLTEVSLKDPVSPEINPCICGQLTYDPNDVAYEWQGAKNI